MKNINAYLKEDVGRIPSNEYGVQLNSEIDNAITVIADFFKDNCEGTYEDKQKIKMLTHNVLNTLDNKFTGKDEYLGELIFKAINTYIN